VTRGVRVAVLSRLCLTSRVGWRSAFRAVAVAVVAAEVLFVLVHAGSGGDAHAYWAAQFPDPYAHSAVDQRDAYLYSPAFLQALTPLRLLPADLFHVIWTSGQALILIWLTGPIIAAIVLVPTQFSPVFTELWFGNITLLLAVMAVRGVRSPAWWALGLLTKVTPGICLLWFLVRREWRHFAIASLTTGIIVLVSFVLAPQAWLSWFALLASSSDAASAALLPGLPVRVAIAALIVIAGALRSERRVLALAIIVALPIFWYASLSLLLAWVYELRHERMPAESDALPAPRAAPA
jgi:Glycosyltransferase family 87